MKHALPFLSIFLCGLAIVFFIKLKSLPAIQEVLLDEVSMTSEINAETFQALKSGAHMAAESGKKSWDKRVIQATTEINRISKNVDSVDVWFNKAKAGLYGEEFSVERKAFLRECVHSDFMPGDNRVMDRLKGYNKDLDNRLKSLVLENIRADAYDVLSYYLDSMAVWTESTNIKFEVGFPSRPPTWKKGLIAFNPPLTMEVGEKDRIQVRISKDLKKSLMDKMPASESSEIDSLLVGDVMIIRLTGDDFDIVAQDEEEQGVLDEGYTQWEFEITPRSSGRHALYVKAGIVYNVPGIGPTKKFFPVYEKEIEIHVDPLKQVASFATDRWEFLVSTFLIPGLVWAFSQVRNRRKKT